MKVGLKVAKSSNRFLMSALWPILASPVTQSTSMNRAKTCASGRKSSVEAPSALTTWWSLVMALSARAMKLSWVS
jgi:hypothetical protein